MFNIQVLNVMWHINTQRQGIRTKTKSFIKYNSTAMLKNTKFISRNAKNSPIRVQWNN